MLNKIKTIRLLPALLVIIAMAGVACIVQTDMPEFSKESGEYTTDISVEITAEAGAAIHYTTDGSDPTESSPVYSEPIAISGGGTTVTIKAIAVKEGNENSDIASAVYTIVQLVQLTQPVFSKGGGDYNWDISVAITAEEGAQIHYTIDGTDPTASSPVYSNPVDVEGFENSMTIKAIAVKAGASNSDITSAAYNITGIGKEIIDIEGNIHRVTATRYLGMTYSPCSNPSGPSMKLSYWVTDWRLYKYDASNKYICSSRIFKSVPVISRGIVNVIESFEISADDECNISVILNLLTYPEYECSPHFTPTEVRKQSNVQKFNRDKDCQDPDCIYFEDDYLYSGDYYNNENSW
ncbi:MAG: hypothetical protein GY754_24965 [bacterium]|nr:hypothetical protein [bacterium]